MKKNIQGLSLLRIFAIIMVVACHTGFLDSTAGGIGNKVFFVLGGALTFFSLAGFFCDKPFSTRGVLKYYLKRIVRIVPSYWLVIILVFFLRPIFFDASDFTTDHSLILNLFFIKTYGHLWFMQQLMLMYLLAPVFVILLEIFRRKVFKKHYVSGCIINIIILLVLAVLEKRYFTPDVFRLSGEGSHQQFQIWMFFIGFACAYLCMIFKDIKIHPAVSGVYFTFYMVISAATVIPAISVGGGMWISFIQGEWLRSFLAAGCIFLFYISKPGIYGKVGGLSPVSFLSESVFGIYLIHFFLLGLFQQWGTTVYFLINLGISMGLALLLHTLLERPLSKLVSMPDSSRQ